jgi:hypothetical protein
MTVAATEERTTTTELPELSERPTLQEAFAHARAKHSTAAAGDTTGDEDEHAADGEESTADGEEEQAEPPAAAEKADKGKTAATTTGKVDGLLTDEEFTALQTKHADDPVALKKSLESAFTKKTQAIAAERKSYERLSKYADIIDAFETDADATLEYLAEQRGMKLVKGEAEGADERASTAAGDSADATDKIDALVDKFKASLGPEYDYMADALAPAIKDLVTELTKGSLEEAAKPIRDTAKVIIDRAAQEQTNATMKELEAKHPDWKEHEEAMLDLAQKIDPKGMSEAEFLDHLYETVTSPKKLAAAESKIEAEVAKRVKARLGKMGRGAADTEVTTESTPADQVRRGSNARPSIRESFALAKQGIRLED